jgi:nicotinamidase-related amidase
MTWLSIHLVSFSVSFNSQTYINLQSMMPQTPLILIDIQNAFYDETYWGKRNNPSFESNVAKLVSHWRSLKQPVIHIQHLSLEPGSPLREGLPGCKFMDFVKASGDELIITKNVNSAFIGTNLERVYMKILGICW